MEKVVIAIPARNSAATLPETLESALRQDYSNFEVVVVDNASDDGTFAVAQKFAERDSRVRIERFDSLVSAEDNFNRCLKIAGGDLLLILHADDLVDARLLSRQVAFLRAHPQVNAVFCHAKTIDEKGSVTGERLLPTELRSAGDQEFEFADLLKLVLKYGNFLTCPSAMLRASTILEKTGGWDGESYGSSADLDLWLRTAEISPIGFISEPLFSYRVSRWSFSVGLSKVRVTKHPLFKAIDAAIARSHQKLSSDDQWNLKFLVAKDDAFVTLNRMKKGETLGATTDRLGFFGTLHALMKSSFHRRFAIRMLAISMFELIYASSLTRKVAMRILQRV